MEEKQNCIHTLVNKWYGAILLQEAEDGKLHPVYYMSKTNTAEEKDYAKRANYSHSQMGASIRNSIYEIEHRAGSRMKFMLMLLADIRNDKVQRFLPKLFNDYCDEENIQHLQITPGVHRGNGQVERIHRTLIPVLTKLSLDDSTKWYKYVDRLQRILNSTICRSRKWTPFELLVGTKMRNMEDILIKDLLVMNPLGHT
ncbi:integrase catalytic domain-containing protein [Trichonephila clavipes]|nr:integrase catalytic domain-containing protein [Trichonephila clavipes]